MAEITDDQRRQVINLHGQGLGRNDIARQTGISAASVSKICQDAGLSFDRSATRAATEAKAADANARRAELLMGELEIMQLSQTRVLQTLRGGESWQTILKGEMGVDEIRALSFIPSPDAKSEAAARASSAIAIQRLEVKEDGARKVASLLGGIAAALDLIEPENADPA